MIQMSLFIQYNNLQSPVFNFLHSQTAGGDLIMIPNDEILITITLHLH